MAKKQTNTNTTKEKKSTLKSQDCSMLYCFMLCFLASVTVKPMVCIVFLSRVIFMCVRDIY